MNRSTSEHRPQDRGKGNEEKTVVRSISCKCIVGSKPLRTPWLGTRKLNVRGFWNKRQIARV